MEEDPPPSINDGGLFFSVLGSSHANVCVSVVTRVHPVTRQSYFGTQSRDHGSRIGTID